MSYLTERTPADASEAVESRSPLTPEGERAAPPRKEHEISDPPPTGDHQIGTPDEAASLSRRDRYRLRERLRPHQPYQRQCSCGRLRIETEVTIVRGEDGRARFGGVARCGSVWACPVCAPAIMADRAQELGRLGTWAALEGHTVVMVTLTLRHRAGDRLEDLMHGLSTAHSRMVSGAPWTRFRDRVGFVGSVRAIEVTHGASGWHPHIHALYIVRDSDAMWGEGGWDWLSERWQTVVERALGPERRPDDAHGCVLTHASHADYVAKFGLDPRELAGGSKRGRRSSSRTAWQIASDLGEGAGERDAELWREYAGWTHGRRQLVWSRGLRVLSGAAAEAERLRLERIEEMSAGRVVAALAATEWCRLCDLRGGRADILEAAELGRLSEWLSRWRGQGG